MSMALVCSKEVSTIESMYTYSNLYKLMIKNSRYKFRICMLMHDNTLNVKINK